VQMIEGDRVGLVAFAGVGFVQCPLTVDYGALTMFLDYLNPDLIPVQGTSIAMALTLATRSLQDASPDSTAGKAIILITDGEDHDPATKEAISQAKEAGVKVFTIGIGSEAGAPIPLAEGGFLKDKSGNLILSRF